jgi:hypothetical protein
VAIGRTDSQSQKVWKKRKFVLARLQALEIAQNRQENPWKSLAETGGKFAKAWQKSLQIWRPGQRRRKRRQADV